VQRIDLDAELAVALVGAGRSAFERMRRA